VPLVATSQLEANLAAHRARWGFEPLIPDSETAVRVETHPGGPWPRVALQTPDGRWLRVHSDRQPLEEAAAWIAQNHADASTTSLIGIIGAGCGYVLEMLEARAAAGTKILLLEPEPAFLRICLGRRDWTGLIETGRLMVLGGPTFEGRAEAWRMVNPTAPDPLIMVHPVIGQARPDPARLAAQVVGQAVAGARANEEARERFAGRYLSNTLRNLPVLARARDVRTLFRRHTGVPAIVVGAGPSLNKNLAELRRLERWRERVIVIAVDTALKPMLAAGLQPHYVVALDPGEANARTLTNLPQVDQTTLVAEASIDPRCFAAFEDRTVVFKVSDTHQPWPWLNTLGIDVGRLRAWGSVLTTAYDLALEIGSDPIVFIGADLAYTNGQPYCRDTIYEEDWAAAIARGATLTEVWQWQMPKAQLVTLDDLDGAPVQSSTILVAFRDWLAAQTARTKGRRHVNATDGGILAGPGLERHTLNTILDGVPVAAPRDVAGASSPQAHGPVANGTSLGNAVRSLLDTAAIPLPHPMPDWLKFASSRTTGVDLLTALADAFPADAGQTGRAVLPAALAARSEAITGEAAAWLARSGSDLDPATPEGWHWRSMAAGDWCLGPTPSTVLPSGPVSDFHSFRYLHITSRRLEHLATLGLPLRERNVLEVGAGVGDLTEFFLDRGCRVHTTDARPLHVTIMQQRFAWHPLVTSATLDLDPPPHDPPGLFDLVVCYGLLYHVSDPSAVLEFLARACSDLLLLETIAGVGDAEAVNPTPENAALAGAAFSGRGCRPSRTWIHARLRELFPHVYTPRTQPNHYEYPVDWTQSSPFARRAIFIASRRPLDNPQLTTDLLDRQSRH